MRYDLYGLDLTSETSCVRYVSQELADFDVRAPADLTLRLELDAGFTPENVKLLRPYGLVADLLDEAPNTTHVNIGKGAAASGTFRDADKTIIARRAQQLKVDARFKLTVPPDPTASPRLPSKSVSVKTVTSWE